MPEFINERFPLELAYGSGGGPMHSTTVVRVQSGHEYRNANWSEPLRVYEPIFGTRTEAELEGFLAKCEAAAGQRRTFRARDANDWKSCALSGTPAQTDQTLVASATGGETTTQIIKSKTWGSVTVSRDILLPVSGTVKVERNGVLLTEGVDYDIDYTQPEGIITWDTSVFPTGLTASDTIKAGFEFDVHVRLGEDFSPIYWEDYKLGRASFSLIEVRV